MPIRIACLEARIDIGEFLAIVSAQRSAAASAPPAGATSLTKPSSKPSLAETCRAVRIMPIARFSPICRGRRCKPPASAARPTRGSGKAKVAFSDAMIRSQASAISKPPPIATPLTAAMIGLSQSNRVVSPAKPPLSQPRSSLISAVLRSQSTGSNGLTPSVLKTRGTTMPARSVRAFDRVRPGPDRRPLAYRCHGLALRIIDCLGAFCRGRREPPKHLLISGVRFIRTRARIKIKIRSAARSSIRSGPRRSTIHNEGKLIGSITRDRRGSEQNGDHRPSGSDGIGR